MTLLIAAVLLFGLGFAVGRIKNKKKLATLQAQIATLKAHAETDASEIEKALKAKLSTLKV